MRISITPFCSSGDNSITEVIIFAIKPYTIYICFFNFSEKKGLLINTNSRILIIININKNMLRTPIHFIEIRNI